MISRIEAHSSEQKFRILRTKHGDERLSKCDVAEIWATSFWKKVYSCYSHKNVYLFQTIRACCLKIALVELHVG